MTVRASTLACCDLPGARRRCRRGKRADSRRIRDGACNMASPEAYGAAASTADAVVIAKRWSPASSPRILVVEECQSAIVARLTRAASSASFSSATPHRQPLFAGLRRQTQAEE